MVVFSAGIRPSDALAREIARSYVTFRDRTLLWTRIGDQGFANLRLLDYTYPRGD